MYILKHMCRSINSFLSTDRRFMLCTVFLFILVALRFICHAIYPHYSVYLSLSLYFYRRQFTHSSQREPYISPLSHWDTYRYCSTCTILFFFHSFCNPAKIKCQVPKALFAYDNPQLLSHSGTKWQRGNNNQKQHTQLNDIINKPRATGTAPSGVHLNTSKYVAHQATLEGPCVLGFLDKL